MRQENLSPFDFVVVTTKNIPDIKPALEDTIRSAVTPSHTVIVLAQNGLHIERPIVQAFPQNPVVSAISLVGADQISPGRILHREPDISVVGPFWNPNIDMSRSENAAQRFVEIYGAAGGVDCTYNPDTDFCRWRKLLYNTAYNSVAAILGLDVTRMRVSEHVIDNLIRPLMGEVRAAARSVGVDLPPELGETFITIDSFESFFKPSMYQDVEKVIAFSRPSKLVNVPIL